MVSNESVDTDLLRLNRAAGQRQLRRLAKRLESDRGYLACTLAALDDATLGDYLGLDVLGVTRLRLCKEPFNVAGIIQIALYVRCDANKLRTLLESWRDPAGAILPECL